MLNIILILILAILLCVESHDANNLLAKQKAKLNNRLGFRTHFPAITLFGDAWSGEFANSIY